MSQVLACFGGKAVLGCPYAQYREGAKVRPFEEYIDAEPGFSACAKSSFKVIFDSVGFKDGKGALLHEYAGPKSRPVN